MTTIKRQAMMHIALFAPVTVALVQPFITMI